MLRIDPTSRVPPYEQLRSQILADIRQGALAPGSKLPPVRRLAVELGLSPNTVARTYRELEAEGHITTAGRHGTRVAAAQTDLEREADRLTLTYLAGMRALGLDGTAIGAHLHRALAANAD